MGNLALAATLVEREITDLLASYPELAEDEEFRIDMLSGSTDTMEVLDRLLSAEREAAFQSEAIKARIDALKARKDAAERRKEAFRKLILRVMSAANLRKVPLAEATLSIRAVPPAVIVTDETKIPEQFWRMKPELDKKSLGEELKAGFPVEGAILSNGSETLAVRA